MKKDIRWGIVGTGNIAHRFAQACKNADGAVLSAVASRSRENAEQFGDEFGIPLRFSSYEDMAKSRDIDAAYIAVPHGRHAECSILFMQNGKGVLCEKPMTLNAAELQKMLDCAARNKVFLMEAMWARLVPGTIKLMEIVNSGKLGKIRGIRGDFCYDMSDEPEHHAFDPFYGGGSLLDVGCYGLSFASWFAGHEVEDIRALAELSGRGVDLHCCATLKYKSGILAEISSGMTVRKPNEGCIYGEKGYAYLRHFYAPETIRLEIYGEGTQTIECPYKGNGFEEQIEEASRCISGGLLQSEFVPHSQSKFICEQTDEIRKQIGVVYPVD